MSEYFDFIANNLFLFGLLLILLAFIVTMEFKKLTKKYKDLAPADAVQLINREQAILLDVREANELSGDGIRHAKHISGSVLAERFTDLEAFKESPIIAFCMNGFKAQKACQLLSKKGFSKIYCLKGGIAAWKQANMPVVKK